MKQILSAITTAAATAAALSFALAGCEQFNTSYERIEETELRMIDFVYDPVDAAPGDTVTLTAYFGGKAVDLDAHIKEWWISFNVISGLFGTTVADSVDLKAIAASTTGVDPQLPNARYIRFRIPLPKDMMRRSPAIPDKWTDMLTPGQLATVPPYFASKSKGEIIQMIEDYRDGADKSIGESAYLPFLLQHFTARFRVSAKIGKENGPGGLPHTIRSDRSVRYNRVFASNASPRVPVNNAPRIDSIVLFKVKKADLLLFDEKTSGLEYSTTRLDNTADNVITVEKGYSYFLKAATERSLDSSMTQFGNWGIETHTASWQYLLKDSELSGVKASDYPNIVNSGGGIRALQPPANPKIKNFILWVTVEDDFNNEKLRPEGGAIAEVRGRFEYRP